MDNKEMAVAFLEAILAGNIDEAYENYVDMDGKHHNTFTSAGFPALQQGMKDAHMKFPDKQFAIQHTLEDGDLVAIHSHLILEPGKLDFAAVHLFRFENGRIVEMWDLSQDISSAVNTDGAF